MEILRVNLYYLQASCCDLFVQSLTVIIGILVSATLLIFGFVRLVFNVSYEEKEQNGFLSFIFVTTSIVLSAFIIFWYYMLRVVFLDYTFVTENPTAPKFFVNQKTILLN